MHHHNNGLIWGLHRWSKTLRGDPHRIRFIRHDKGWFRWAHEKGSLSLWNYRLEPFLVSFDPDTRRGDKTNEVNEIEFTFEKCFHCGWGDRRFVKSWLEKPSTLIYLLIVRHGRKKYQQQISHHSGGHGYSIPESDSISNNACEAPKGDPLMFICLMTNFTISVTFSFLSFYRWGRR